MTPSREAKRAVRPGEAGATLPVLRRLLGEEEGQDIVEYALLGLLIGISAVLIWQQLAITVGNVYGEAVAPTTGVQAVSACTPDPGGGGC